jgi:hypothetical protein
MCGIRSMVPSVGFEAPLDSAEGITDVPVLLEDGPVVVVVVVLTVSDEVPCGAVELEVNDGDAAGPGAASFFARIADSLACSRDEGVRAASARIADSLACSRDAAVRAASARISDSLARCRDEAASARISDSLARSGAGRPAEPFRVG